MKRNSKLLLVAVSLGVLLLASTAQATLMGRLPATPGGTDYQAAYDDVLNITWVTNAALSGPGAWQTQVDWASNLNYLGFDDWRLASMSVAAGVPTSNSPQHVNSVVDCRFATEMVCRDNELGYMFYQNMAGVFLNNKTGLQIVDGVQLSGVQSLYKSGTEFNAIAAWSFNFLSGSQNLGAKSSGGLSGWAVRSGDVGAVVPEPGTFVLLGAGLGLLGFGRSKRRI